MKKLIALTLALCMSLSLFAACDAGEQDQPLTTKPATPGTTEATEPAKATEPAPATITETVLFDQDGIKITVTGIEYDDIWGTDIKFLVENNTDKNITLSGDECIVNGVTMHGWLYIQVAAGKKSNDTLSLSASDLDAADITSIATFSAPDAHVIDGDSYDLICDTPLFFETPISGTYTQQINDAGDVVFDQEGITVIAQTINDEYYGNTVQLLVKNATDETVTVQAENISVNGFTMSAWMYDLVYANTVRYCSLDLFSSGLEENGIETIEEVTFTLRIIDSETYDEIATSDEIQVFVAQ